MASLLSFLTEPFAADFMVRAFVAGITVGGLCALLGVFVVQRGLAFIGDGLAHAAFGGIALGLLLGPALGRMTWLEGRPEIHAALTESGSAVALPFTVIVALGIAYVLRRGKLRGDAATGR
jgi:zinc transport system permease protein